MTLLFTRLHRKPQESLSREFYLNIYVSVSRYFTTQFKCGAYLLCVELAEPGIEDGVSWDLRFEAPKDGGPIPADCGMLGELGATGG